jgi:hypothetical protein
MNIFLTHGSRLLCLGIMLTAVTGTAWADVLVDYEADTLPPAPWEFVSNGDAFETSHHSVSAADGILHMVDSAPGVGNTLGYFQPLAFDPAQLIEVEFRARILSGQSQSTFQGQHPAPFSVWLYNGALTADLSVGPTSLTALGGTNAGANGIRLLLNRPFDGTDWHVYRYRLDPSRIQWWADGVSLGSAASSELIPAPDSTDRRINMFITSATADVELDYIVVSMTAITEVAIDVRPDSATNPINPKSKGVITVAILTTATFDATTVDPATVRFGAIGTEAAPVHVAIQDVNGDGLPDLLLHVKTQDTDIQCGATSALLTGETFDGQPVEGSDTIVTVGCH